MKPRDMRDAPRDGRFIGILSSDGRVCDAGHFEDGHWYELAGMALFTDEEAVSDGKVWIALPKWWLHRINKALLYRAEGYT